MNKHFFIDGVRVASSARSWTAPIASVPALLTWRAPDLPGLPYGVVGFGCGAFGLLLLGLALRRRARGTDEGSLALRLGSVGTLLLVTPALLASPCGVGPPPVTSGLGTHDEPALFYLTDHLGSTILTIEDGGTARNRYLYMPFGDPGIANEGPSLRHRFTGQEILEGTGLYMLGARVYDPETGRFLEPDPIVPAAANPQSFNRYSYGYNSPLNLKDPTGFSPRGEEGSNGRPPSSSSSQGATFRDSSRGPGVLNLKVIPPADMESLEYLEALYSSTLFLESVGQSRPHGQSSTEILILLTQARENAIASQTSPPSSMSSVESPSPGPRPYFLDVEHVFLEAFTIEASLASGVVVAGTSALASFLAIVAAPETGGLSLTLLPFTMTGVAGGGYLISVGISGNIDILNTILDPFVGRPIPNPFEGEPGIPKFPLFSGEQH